MEWIRWYVPWAYLDGLLRIEFLIWIAAFCLSVLVWFWVVRLKHPWLRLDHMKSASQKRKRRN